MSTYPEQPIVSCGIRIGEGIPGTSLLRQFRGDEEIPPLSCPETGLPLAKRIERARSEAKSNNYTRVQVERVIYEV